MKTPHGKLRSLRFQPACRDRRGLLVAGTIQLFPFEKQARSAFAELVASYGRPVVNIGYGYGFAHAALIDRLPDRVTLIEANSKLSRRAARAHGKGTDISNAPLLARTRSGAPLQHLFRRSMGM